MEYRSRVLLLGLPLVHICLSRGVDGHYRRGIATGWIAFGDIAFGILFACGGVAVGGISLGGIAVGALSIGGFSIGALAFGGLAVGIIAIGGAAFAWHAAVGGLAVAHEFATGGVALAQHIVPPPARGASPLSAIPHASFRWTDAVWLALIAWVLLRVTWSVQTRLKR